MRRGAPPTATPLGLGQAEAQGRGYALDVGGHHREGGARGQLADALAALEIQLSPEEVAQLEAAVPAAEVAGTRCAAPMMAHLDAGRPAQLA